MIKLFLLCLSAISMLGASLLLSSGDVASPEERGVPPVAVEKSGREWMIAGKHNRVSVNESDLRITVKSGSTTWSMMPSSEGELTVQVDTSLVKLRLADAGEIKVSPYETGFKTGIKVTLSSFNYQEESLDLVIQLFITLETSEDELVCEMVPLEGKNVVKELLWPKGFVPGSTDFTVLPYRQGVLLSGDWPHEVTLRWHLTHTVGMYMPWWGHLKGNSAVLVLLETPDDAGCRFEHAAGGPTVIEPRWIHSLGKFRYPRKARLCFLENADYVDLAKRYRKYTIETGHFVSLKEKIARTPVLAKLIGSPVAHFGILVHILPESRYYNKENPEKNHHFTSFDRRAEQLGELSRKGIDKLYIHLDGWGYRGYDNLHPEYLPPSPEAGGWEGMKRLADTCDRLGYVFALHDQYRDYYLDAPSYNPRHTVVYENGERPSWAIWLGGKQSLICQSLSPGFVARNHRALGDHGIKVRGSYLDVFACNPMDECYNPEHPVTRTECKNYRAQCFNLIRAWEGVVSSEEPVDWAIPYLDLVHHGPYALDSGSSGNAIGITIPLFNLVYHDAILVPWFTSDRAYAIPETDTGYMHGLMNAGMPYISLSPDEEEMEKVRTLCALHERVGLLEMTEHEFIDGNYRKHRTTFADGTTVTVNFDANTFEVSPELILKK